MVRFALVACLLALTPMIASAQVDGVQGVVEEAAKLHVHPISVVPFAALLLSIAILPLVAGHFWHSNVKKLLVSLGLALPVLIYLLTLGHHGAHALVESLIEYAQFIVLLGSLYAISGGIVLEGDLKPTAAVNTGILLLGAVLANFVGTTGASMLLIRPFLKINGRRIARVHLPVFFIFLVSNLGGLLTPLGDPPLFLGFLRGVRFFWTLGLWQHWLVAVGIVACIFYVWDTIALRSEPPLEMMENVPGTGPLRIRGAHNFVFLAGIVVVTLFLSDSIAQSAGSLLPAGILGEDVVLTRLIFPWGGIWMVVLATLSYLSTPSFLRKENDFSWGAILEVAALFIGIFITMVPALSMLETDGHLLGIQKPWQYFWATGVLSSFLDNAPTYLSFATLAGGKDFAHLQDTNALILQAISVGAVFMGANTYIGNGPNFMVKAIADEAGYPTPSFFGYMLYSGLILLPTFGVITFVFFR